jgi:cytochrome oxidase Cu insertion factor (SCO1/SenC/PrrC family)
VASFGNFVAAHGWAVNLVAVVALATIGGLLLSGRRRLTLAGLIALVLLCVADWVLVEDLGFLGGVGTDPNSMLPMALLFVSGYVAMVRVPVAADVPETATDTPAMAAHSAQADAPAWWERASLSYAIRTTAAFAALAIVLVGAAPMATAAVNGNADPILTEALNGSPNALELPAPHFTLTDQRGQTVSLGGLRGHTVALTFLDPVCTSDCPLIAQEFRQTDQQLGAAARGVDFVAIVANPIYRSISFTDAFDRQESMNHLPNWYFLTGSLAQLRRVWNSYGVLVNTVGAGAMIAHSDLAFIIDRQGRERDALIDDPGPTQTFASSFSSLLQSQIDQVRNS